METLLPYVVTNNCSRLSPQSRFENCIRTSVFDTALVSAILPQAGSSRSHVHETGVYSTRTITPLIFQNCSTLLALLSNRTDASRYQRLALPPFRLRHSRRLGAFLGFASFLLGWNISLESWWSRCSSGWYMKWSFSSCGNRKPVFLLPSRRREMKLSWLPCDGIFIHVFVAVV